MEVAIASEDLAQEKASGQAALATLDREREPLIQQRIQIQQKLEHDSHELQQVETDLSQATITAEETVLQFLLRKARLSADFVRVFRSSPNLLVDISWRERTWQEKGLYFSVQHNHF